LEQEQVKLLSAELLVMLEKVEEESKNEEGRRWPRARNRIDNESDDEFAQRVGRDEAGGVLLQKRGILVGALRKLGNLTEDEIRQVSAEFLVGIEKEYELDEYANDVAKEKVVQHWGPLIAYWDFLRRTQSADTQPGE